MLDALTNFIEPWLPWLALGSLASLVLAAIAVPLIVIELPAGYFARAERGEIPWWARHPLLRLPLHVFKNVIAMALIALGLLLLLLPGQGLLTIAVGVLLADFPGKYRLERWLVCRPRILRMFNRIRARAGKPPFEDFDGESVSSPRSM
ncbi:MAG: hypothetical protein RLW61_12880 [Gammaproteobacteria bacterium]